MFVRAAILASHHAAANTSAATAGMLDKMSEAGRWNGME
jgi:hypothetical protein